MLCKIEDIQISDGIYETPKSDLGETQKTGVGEKLLYSFLSLVSGFLIVDFGSFLFKKTIRENMNWVAYQENYLVVDTALYWLAFISFFITLAGFVSYKLAKFYRMAHLLFLALLSIILPILVVSEKMVPIWFTALHSSILLVGFCVGGWLCYRYEKRGNKSA